MAKSSQMGWYGTWWTCDEYKTYGTERTAQSMRGRRASTGAVWILLGSAIIGAQSGSWRVSTTRVSVASALAGVDATLNSGGAFLPVVLIDTSLTYVLFRHNGLFSGGRHAL
jgi:hypothetical protein